MRNPLTLSSDLGCESPLDAASPTEYSSLHSAALAMIVTASEQAVQSAASADPPRFEARPQPTDHTRSVAVQRASAEQARRSANCARAALDGLFHVMSQPAFVLDQNGCVVAWNAAIARWTGIPESRAFGTYVRELFAEVPDSAVANAALALLQVEALDENESSDPALLIEGPHMLKAGPVARSVSLLPIKCLPSVVERLLVLITV